MTENRPLVSIIMPVYNVEKFLATSIESALKQTFTDFELIIVNDGSRDGSGTICDQYAASNGCIKVFHTPNHGVSAARLLGAQQACGKWISFLDSDDELTERSLELLIGASQKTDAKVIKGAFKYVHTDSSKEKIFNAYHEKESNFADFFKRYRSFNIWSGLFDRELFLSLFQPPPELKMGEDRVIIYQAIAVTDKVYSIPELTYLYKYNENSVVSTYINHYRDPENFRAYIESFDRAIVHNPRVKFVNRMLIRRDCIYMVYRFMEQCTAPEHITLGRQYLKQYLYNSPIQMVIDLLSRIKKQLKK